MLRSRTVKRRLKCALEKQHMEKIVKDPDEQQDKLTSKDAAL